MNHVKGIANHLATVGQPVTTHDLRLYVIGGLGSNYTSFIASMNICETLSILSAIYSYLKGYNHILYKQSCMSSNQVYHTNYAYGNNFSRNSKNAFRGSNPKSPSYSIQQLINDNFGGIHTSKIDMARMILLLNNLA